MSSNIKKFLIFAVLSISMLFIVAALRHYQEIDFARQREYQRRRGHDSSVLFNLSSVSKAEREFYKRFNRYGSVKELVKLNLVIEDPDSDWARAFFGKRENEFIVSYTFSGKTYFYMDSQGNMFMSKEDFFRLKNLSFDQMLNKIRASKNFEPVR